MEQTFFILSLLIPGPIALWNDIDIYLQPLIDELNELWEVGVETYDASIKQNFCMHAAILWTINNFLLMQTFLVGVLKGNLLPLFVIRIVCHIDYKTNGNGVTWVIVDFY